MGGEPQDRPRGLWRRRVLYPDLYVWLILVSSLDILTTWMVLYFEGAEVNLLANFFIERYGRGGIVAFKFTLVCFIIICCEVIGRQRPTWGRHIAAWAIALPAAAVALGFVQLLVAVM
jgi:hypothetical protein